MWGGSNAAGTSEGGKEVHFPFWRAACVCEGDVLSDFRPLGDGKDDVRLTHCLLSELRHPRNSLFQSRFEEMAGTKEGTSSSQTMRTSGGGSGG